MDPELWGSVLLLGPQNGIKEGAPVRAATFTGLAGVLYKLISSFSVYIERN